MDDRQPTMPYPSLPQYALSIKLQKEVNAKWHWRMVSASIVTLSSVDSTCAAPLKHKTALSRRICGVTIVNTLLVHLFTSHCIHTTSIQ